MRFDFEKFKKGAAREAAAFLCLAAIGTILVPTFLMIVLSFFGLVPRNENLFEGYAALLRPFDSHRWVVLIPILAPYFFYRATWFVRKKYRKTDPEYTR
jgi:hypothetical protein